MADIFDKISGGTATADVFDRVASKPSGGDVFDRISTARPQSVVASPAETRLSQLRPDPVRMRSLVASGRGDAALASMETARRQAVRETGGRGDPILAASPANRDAAIYTPTSITEKANDAVVSASNAAVNTITGYGGAVAPKAALNAQKFIGESAPTQDNVVNTMASGAGSLAAQLPLMVFGGPAAAAGAGFVGGAGQGRIDVARAREQGKQISGIEEARTALGYGVAEGAGEYVGAKALAPLFKAGGNKLVKSVEALVSNYGEEAATQIMQNAVGGMTGVRDNKAPSGLLEGANQAGLAGLGGAGIAVVGSHIASGGNPIQQLQDYRARLQEKGKDTSAVDAKIAEEEARIDELDRQLQERGRVQQQTPEATPPSDATTSGVDRTRNAPVDTGGVRSPANLQPQPEPLRSTPEPDGAAAVGGADVAGGDVFDRVAAETTTPLSNSWIIVDKSTGGAIQETYQKPELDPEKYAVVPAHEYLVDLNKKIAANEPGPWFSVQPETTTIPQPGKFDDLIPEKQTQPTAYHSEQAPDAAERILFPKPNQVADRLYVSNSPDLALGQGQNAGGIKIEFDPQMKVEADKSKPSAGFVAQQGMGEFLSVDPQSASKVRKLTISPETLQQKPFGTRWKNVVIPRLKKAGWNVETDQGGNTVITRAQATTLQPLAGKKQLAARKGFVSLGAPKTTTKGQNFELTNDGIWDKLRRKVQDEFLPLKKMQEDVVRQGGKITDESDPYLAQEVYQGRVGQQMLEVESDYTKPIVKEMQKSGLSLEDVDKYLYAQHAVERNAQIAKVNPKMPDGGSGMTNAEAAKVIADVAASGKQKSYDRIAQAVYGMLDRTRKLQLDTGLITPEAHKAWTDTYKQYVPLRTDMEEEGMRTGQGFNIRGTESKRATGRSSVADSPLTFALMQAQEKIIRAEKNRVGQAMLKFVTDNPDPELWSVGEHKTIKTINPTTGLVQSNIDPRYQFSDNVVAVKDGGETKLIEFKGLAGARIASAMKRLNSSKLNALLRTTQTATGIYRKIQTSWNPDFLLPNLTRDIQTAATNTTADKSAKAAIKSVKNIPKAMKAAFDVSGNYNASLGSEYHDYMREYLSNGGKVDSFSQDGFDATQKKFARLLDRASKDGVVRTLAAIRSAGEMLERVNGSMETATRFSTYVELRKQGVTPIRAASYAKNLTVNFNRKGEWGSAINALYVFSNASIQGNARMLKSLTTTRRGAAVATGIIAAGLAYGLMAPKMMGDDEDGRSVWSTIPDYEKESHLFIPLGKKRYAKIPLPYGYNLLFNIGRNTGEVMTGQKNPVDAATKLAFNTVSTFNPLGGEGSLLQTLSPTILDPVVQVSENKDWTGKRIVPDQNPFSTPKPQSQLSTRKTSSFAKGVAEFLNSATGGDKVVPGKIDISPALIDHLIDFAAGGAGRFAERVAKLPSNIKDGLEPQDIPIARRFVGKAPDRQNIKDLYDALREIDEVNDRAREYVKLKDSEKARLFINQNRTAINMKHRANSIRDEMKKLREVETQSDAKGQKDLADKARERSNLLAKRFLSEYNGRKNSVSTNPG